MSDVTVKFGSSAQPAGHNKWKVPCRICNHKTPDNHLQLEDTGKGVILNHYPKPIDPKEFYRQFCQMYGFDNLYYSTNDCKARGEFVKAYTYTDAEGNPAHETVRYKNPKSFSQRRPDPNKANGYIDNLDGINTYLYGLPQLIEAVRANRTILICEGEKDCETVWDMNWAATTNPMGAGKWKNNYSDYLKGANVVIVQDKDNPTHDPALDNRTKDPGKYHALDVAKSLSGKAKSIKILELPDRDLPAKDLSDWVAAGGDSDELQQLIDNAPAWTPSNDTSDKAKTFDWRSQLIPHDVLLNKQLQPIEFLIEGILVNCGTGALAGLKKKGKTWMASQITQAVAGGNDFLGHKVKQGKVVHFALEDGERRMQKRLRQQKAASGLPIDWVYKWPALNTPEGFTALRDMLVDRRPHLVVIDTLGKCLNGKPDQNSAGDMGEFGNKLHDLALEFNVMILFIAHHGKGMPSRDPGLDIRGSSAIPGATDVNIGLYKNDDGTFELIGEGRDIEEFDIRVSLDKENDWKWKLEGDAKDLRRTETEIKIWDALNALGDTDAESIAKEIQTKRANAQIHLKRMRSGPEATIAFETFKENKKTKIIYRLLTSLTSSTPLHYQHYLQNKGIQFNDVNDVNENHTSDVKGVK